MTMNNDSSGAVEASKRYVLIPLPLVRSLFLEENAVRDMLDYGIYSYSLKMKASSEDAFFELVRCYYHESTSLTDGLTYRLDSYVNDDVLLSPKEARDTNEREISNELLRYVINKEEDESFIEQVKTWYKVFLACRLLCIKPNTIKFTLDNKVLSKYKNSLAGCPLIAVGSNYLVDAQKRKSIDERILLAYQLGIMSLIGMHRQWCATTKDMIRARMFGYKNPAEMERDIKKEVQTLVELNKKLSSRWAMDNLRDKALNTKLLGCCFGYGHRVYVSVCKTFDEIKTEIADSLNTQKTKNELKQQRLELEMLLTQKNSTFKKNDSLEITAARQQQDSSKNSNLKNKY